MSSLGESSHADGITSEEPMLNSGLAEERPSESYSNRMKLFARRGRCAWVAFIGLTTLVLVGLVIGAVILLVRSNNVQAVYQPDTYTEMPKQGQQKQENKLKEFRFEYETGEESKDQVIINVKDNYTELFAEDISVFNYFRKRISLHRVEISPGVQLCLFKLIEKEVKPGELEEALSVTTYIQVNSSELYVIDSSPVSDAIINDMTVLQYCHRSPIYALKSVDPFGPDVGMTMEELLDQFTDDSDMYTRRFIREVTASPLDTHNGGPYHCGGPIGSNREALPASEYTCTKTNNYCYKSLVNERCDECYHGHNMRTTGCWCPISAIETCIRITYKPVERYCCGVNAPPCIRSECETRRIPFVPVPVITVKILPTNS